jgi:hypothetical protein
MGADGKPVQRFARMDIDLTMTPASSKPEAPAKDPRQSVASFAGASGLDHE